MVFKFQKILFLEFRVARVSKKRPGLVRVFKNTGTAGQISGRVWTRPSPTSATAHNHREYARYTYIYKMVGIFLLKIIFKHYFELR